ncbi:MAG: ATP-binding cassette domain-containing protein [Anaerolineae bacterium]|nr:ATP-binding cassette domain-containing protein [Anaerolineae bacterium]
MNRAPSDAPLIQVEGASYRYPDGTAAITDISLQVQPGEYVALVGRNGCGKSTLCRLMNGLLLPNPGRILVRGMDTREPGTELPVRSTVAMVFQVPDNQIVATVVEHDVAFGPENLGIPTPELRLRVREALETVGMWEQRERAPHLLSEGEKQLVAIAGALAMHPRCLILDEATSMLDPVARDRVLAVARQVHLNGVSVIVVTHNLSEALEARRVLALDRGHLAYDGPPMDLLKDDDLMAQLGLAAPPASQVAREVHRRRPFFPRGLHRPEEVAKAVLEFCCRPA